MTKPPIDMVKMLARLLEITIFELRGEWRRLHRASPPMRLSRDLLMRGITYKLQERSLGALSKSILRKLDDLNLESKASAAQKLAAPVLSIGAKLRRAGKGKRLIIANGANAEVNQGLVELIKEAFSIRNQLLSGSDDSIEAMSARLGTNKLR